MDSSSIIKDMITNLQKVGFTQQQIAEKLGVTQPWVSVAASGRRGRTDFRIFAKLKELHDAFVKEN